MAVAAWRAAPRVATPGGCAPGGAALRGRTAAGGGTTPRCTGSERGRCRSRGRPGAAPGRPGPPRRARCDPGQAAGPLPGEPGGCRRWRTRGLLSLSTGSSTASDPRHRRLAAYSASAGARPAAASVAPSGPSPMATAAGRSRPGRVGQGCCRLPSAAPRGGPAPALAGQPAAARSALGLVGGGVARRTGLFGPPFRSTVAAEARRPCRRGAVPRLPRRPGGQAGRLRRVPPGPPGRAVRGEAGDSTWRRPACSAREAAAGLGQPSIGGRASRPFQPTAENRCTNGLR